MKTLRNFIAWVLLAIVSNTFGAELKVADFSIMPGQQQEVSVQLDNADYECIMLDFWMSLPEGVTIAKDEDDELMYEESSARFRKSHSMEVAEKEGNTYHILIFSTKNETLKGTSGTLFTLTLEAASTAPQGQQQGRFYNQIFSDADRQEHNPADVSFNITVGNTNPAEDIEADYHDYIPISVWNKAVWRFDEWSLIRSISSDLDMSEEQFNAAYELDATSGTVKQYQRNGLTETIGSITYENGYIYWNLGDWQTVVMRITGTSNADDAIMLLQGDGSYQEEDFTTYIRYKNKSGNGGDVYVLLVKYADELGFLKGSVGNKDLSSWYALNSTQSGSKELHVGPPTPAERGSDYLNVGDYLRDMSGFWTQGGPSLSIRDGGYFGVSADDFGVSYRFTIPKQGVNEAFSSSSEATWTVKGCSGQNYELHLEEAVLEDNGQVSYKAIYDQNSACIVRINGKRIEYQYNSDAADILNYAGRLDADGLNNTDYMGSGHTFTAYVELYCTGNTPPYGVLLDDPYFNVRFQRPLNIYSVNAMYKGNANVSATDLVSGKDWRNYTVDFKKKINSNGQNIGYGYYGISYVSINKDDILTDYAASSSVKDNITSLLQSRQLTQEKITELMDQLTSASSVFSNLLSVSDVMKNGLQQSNLTYTPDGSINQTFHLFVPVAVPYNWGDDRFKTWAVITIEPDEQQQSQLEISIADKAPTIAIEDCDDSSWTGTNGLGGHLYETYDDACLNHPATHEVAFNATLDMMSFLDIHYSDAGVVHQPMTPALFKQKGLQLEFYLERDNNGAAYASLEVFRDPDADFGVSNVNITPRNMDASGSIDYSSPADRSVIGRDIIVKVLVVNNDGEVQATGYVRTVITDVDELITLPAGVAQEEWHTEGLFRIAYSWGWWPARNKNLKVAFDGNDVYVQGLSNGFPDAWVKGTLANGKAVFASGQYVGENENGKRYMNGCTVNSEGTFVYEDAYAFTFDTEAQELTIESGFRLHECSGKNSPFSYSFYTYLCIVKGELEMPVPVVVPEGLETEDYLFSAQLSEEIDEDNNAIYKDFETNVRIGFNGDDVYIQGIYPFYELTDTWVKGKKNGTVLTFETGQYMGAVYGVHDCYFVGIDDKDIIQDVVLNYDDTKEEFTTDQRLRFSAHKNYPYYRFSTFKDCKFTKIKTGEPTSLDNMNIVNNRKDYYDALGFRKDKVSRGLNIIRMEDGSIRKVAVY